MLAYYSSLVKKEELMERISLDADQVASLANNLVCDLKVFSSACKNKNIEICMESIKSAEEYIKIVEAMTQNLKSNVEGYVSAIVPNKQELFPQERQDNLSKEEQQRESDITENKLNSSQEKSAPDLNQISTLLEAIKSLRDMKDSISK
jgi:hypothetical protein